MNKSKDKTELKKRILSIYKKSLLHETTQFRYIKITLLLITIALSYYLFSNPTVQEGINSIHNLSYLGIFIAGILFSFGFTASFAVGFFIVLNPSNIFLASIVGGLGALIADLTIFKFVKLSMKEEFKHLEKTKLIKRTEDFINKHIGVKIKVYLLYIFAGIIISSPLPDEIGVSLLAGISSIKQTTLAIISFILNTLGILILFVLSSQLF